MRATIVALLAILIAPVAAFSQTLADRIPADAQIYIGCKGSDDLGAGYANSHLKAVIDASQFSQLFSDSIPRLVDSLTSGDEDAAQQARLVMNLAMSVLHHPTAIYFGGVDLPATGQPMPRIAILCDAGDDATALSQKVSQIISQAPQGTPLRLQTFGTLLVVATFDFPEHPSDPLAQNAQFQDAMSHGLSDPVVAMYMDGAALLKTTDGLVEKFAPQQSAAMWPQIRDALGLGGLKYAIGTDGFDGKNWGSRLFISAPGTRTGLFAPAANVPLGQDFLSLIPMSATMAGGCSVDLSALFTQIDNGIQQISPETANQFHQALQQVSQMLGFDLQKDFLGAIGPQWGYYVDPATAGAGALGLTIINQPRNPDRLQTSLTALENIANVAVRQQLANSTVKMTLEIRQFTSNGVTVHYLATPFISPSWAIKDGRWYGALYPQIIVAAINRQPDGKSILDNPGYQAVIKELGAPSQFGGFQFNDLPQTMPQGYQAWLLLSRMYLGYGDLFGLQSPPMVVPTLDKLMSEAEPSGSVSWQDDSGFYVRSITPFPGADALGASW
jgi:hypothetical protein